MAVACRSWLMAILAPLIAFAGRFIGKLLNMAFGWASTLLFGRVPQSKQLLLSGISLAAIAWVAALIGVILPDVGSFLLAFVPRPDWVQEGWLRLVMLLLALILPLVVGIAGIILLDPADRPSGGGTRRRCLARLSIRRRAGLGAADHVDRGAYPQGAEHPQGLDR